MSDNSPISTDPVMPAKRVFAVITRVSGGAYTQLQSLLQPIVDAVKAQTKGTAADPVNITGAVSAGVKTPHPVSVQGTVPVSGSFWQVTQPVSGTVQVGNFPATQAISGTVGLSGTVSLDPTALAALNAAKTPSTQPVSGTFWQATQPVSGAFWPDVQPISGTVSLTPPATYAEATWSSSNGRSATRTTKGAKTLSWFVTLSGGLTLGSISITPVGSDDGTAWFPVGPATSLATGATTSGSVPVTTDFMALQLSTSGTLLNLITGVTKAKTAIHFY